MNRKSAESSDASYRLPRPLSASWHEHTRTFDLYAKFHRPGVKTVAAKGWRHFCGLTDRPAERTIELPGTAKKGCRGPQVYVKWGPIGKLHQHVTKFKKRIPGMLYMGDGLTPSPSFHGKAYRGSQVFSPLNNTGSQR